MNRVHLFRFCRQYVLVCCCLFMISLFTACQNNQLRLIELDEREGTIVNALNADLISAYQIDMKNVQIDTFHLWIEKYVDGVLVEKVDQPFGDHTFRDLDQLEFYLFLTRKDVDSDQVQFYASIKHERGQSYVRSSMNTPIRRSVGIGKWRDRIPLVTDEEITVYIHISNDRRDTDIFDDDVFENEERFIQLIEQNEMVMVYKIGLFR